MNNYIFSINNYINHKKTDLVNDKIHTQTKIKLKYNKNLKEYLIKNIERIYYLKLGFDDNTLTDKEICQLINLEYLKYWGFRSNLEKAVLKLPKFKAFKYKKLKYLECSSNNNTINSDYLFSRLGNIQTLECTLTTF